MRVLRPSLVSFAALLVACGGGGGGNGGVVNPPPAKTLDHITVSPTTLPLAAGQSQTITAQGLAADGSAINGTTFSYNSSDETKATVTAAGRVLGVAAGTATITVTGTAAGINRSATVAVTVTGNLPNAVTVVAGAATNDFTPRDVAIARGGTVTWSFPGILHNVEFQGGGAPANIPNSGNNASVARTFANAGNFQYLCSLHSGMSGSVLVP